MPWPSAESRDGLSDRQAGFSRFILICILEAKCPLGRNSPLWPPRTGPAVLRTRNKRGMIASIAQKDLMTPASGTTAIVDLTTYDLKQASWHCDQLERGKVLFFSHVPFDFPDADREFLLSQKQTGSRFHKNISYRPAKDILKGVDNNSPDRERMNTIMRNFSAAVTRFVSQFLAPYAGK